MKIKSSTYLLLAGVLCCLVPRFTLAESTFAINQFRAPYSLSEILHDGLVFVQNSLEQVVTRNKEHSVQLLMIADKLHDLESLYSQMYAKSPLNEIRRDERDFLQGLIDRIDQMIQHLESDEANPQDQELIKRNLDLLQNLKDQLGH